MDNVLVYELIEEALLYIRKITSFLKEELITYRRGVMPDKRLTDVLSGVQDMLDVVSLTEQVTSIDVQGSVSTVKELVNELLNAISNEDTVTVSDIIEYDLISLLNDWNDKFITAYENKPL